MLKKIGNYFLVVVFFYLTSMMIILGNGSSFLGRYFSDLFLPIANSIGLNTTWNFFSPDPAHTMYLKYHVLFQDEYGNEIKPAIEKNFPEDAMEHNFSLQKRRLSYVMRFLASDQSRIEKYLIPWVCQKNKEASHIQTELVLYRIPSLDVVTTFKSENYNHFLIPEEINPMKYSCVR